MYTFPAVHIYSRNIRQRSCNVRENPILEAYPVSGFFPFVRKQVVWLPEQWYGCRDDVTDAGMMERI